LNEIRKYSSNFEVEAKEGLVGHSVVARYGNKRNYVVTDIDFRLTPETYEFDTPEGRVNMITYLEEKYRLKVKVKNQPLIICQRKKGMIFGITGPKGGKCSLNEIEAACDEIFKNCEVLYSRYQKGEGQIELRPRKKKDIIKHEEVRIVIGENEKFVIKKLSEEEIEKFRKDHGSDYYPRTSAFLAPEFCGLTGLPEEVRADYNAMKQIAVHTKLTPDSRTERMQKLLQQFKRLDVKYDRGNTEAKRKVDPDQPGNIMRNWNLEINSQSIDVEGRVLPPQKITLGKYQILDVPSNGQFFFKQPIVSPLALDKWILIHTTKDGEQAGAFVETLYKASSTFGINVDYPTYGESRGTRARDFIDAAENAMKSLKDPQVIVFILPRPSESEYKFIKKWAVTLRLPIITQMIKSKTLNNPKGLMPVCSKVILQITAKRNGDLWRVKIPQGIPKKVMMVGIDVSREARSTYLGFASSYDPNFCKYYTQIQKLGANQEISSTIGNLFVIALNRFYTETQKKFLPDLIVIYRDGVGDSQENELIKMEFETMMNSMIAQFPTYKPRIIYATVNKKIHTRLFNASGAPAAGGRGGRGGRGYSEEGYLSNPLPGTVVHSGIVSSRFYEFLIMPQYVNEGTGTPARIHVIYDKSELPIETFEELTNALCYGYDNWQGAIRTPAPCKYALAHAKLAAKYTKTIPDDRLLSLKYYL